MQEFSLESMHELLRQLSFYNSFELKEYKRTIIKRACQQQVEQKHPIIVKTETVAWPLELWLEDVGDAASHFFITPPTWAAGCASRAPGHGFLPQLCRCLVLKGRKSAPWLRLPRPCFTLNSRTGRTTCCLLWWP